MDTKPTHEDYRRLVPSDRELSKALADEARGKRLELIPRRRYVLVAERLSPAIGDRTARWFYDKQTGTWYLAESWKRPNLGRPLNAEQVAYVETLLGENAEQVRSERTAA